MTNNITLIESEKLDELLEKAFAFDQLQNPTCGYILNKIDWKQVEIDKANYLAKYVEIPMDFDDIVVDKLDELGYE